MGPACLLSYTADGLEWAQHVSSELLPMVSNGPSMSPQLYCQWSRMGPAYLLRDAADGLEWAQHVSSKKLLMVSDGPRMSPQRDYR
jgi:hypothetical protein